MQSDRVIIFQLDMDIFISEWVIFLQSMAYRFVTLEISFCHSDLYCLKTIQKDNSECFLEVRCNNSSKKAKSSTISYLGNFKRLQIILNYSKKKFGMLFFPSYELMVEWTFKFEWGWWLLKLSSLKILGNFSLSSHSI